MSTRPVTPNPAGRQQGKHQTVFSLCHYAACGTRSVDTQQCSVRFTAYGCTRLQAHVTDAGMSMYAMRE